MVIYGVYIIRFWPILSMLATGTVQPLHQKRDLSNTHTHTHTHWLAPKNDVHHESQGRILLQMCVMNLRMGRSQYIID